jgi:hypothetical protein
MFIELRQVGRKSRPLDGWAVPNLPTLGDSGGEGITLRDLIARIVRSEVAAFQVRANGRRFVRALTETEIAKEATQGKIDPGGRESTDTVEPEAAVSAALQGFEDGLYLVTVDGVEQRSLDSQVYLRADSKLVFLRLTFLAGA